MELTPYLDDLERRLDERKEEDLLARWRSFLDGACAEEVFCPTRGYQAPPAVTWPAIPINDAIADQSFDLMILRELASCSVQLAKGSGRVLNVRSNYGTAILPSLFGADVFYLPREMDTLPTSRPLARRALEEVIRGDRAPDGGKGFAASVFAMAESYLQRIRGYPKISRCVWLYHPDLQSPMDVCELLWGSDLFLALYDRPEEVATLLRRLTDAYTMMMRKWYDTHPARGPYTAHWGFLFKGRIMLRCDSAMNLSPQAYRQFIMPYDAELLSTFGGGAMHFCGRGSHYIPDLCSISALTAVNVSQPHLNDMEGIYRYTVDRGIFLLDLAATAIDDARRSGRSLRGRCSGLS